MNTNTTKRAFSKRVIFFAAFSFVIGIALTLSLCNALLSSQKTATGVISIVLPPTAGVGTADLFYDGDNAKMYVGKSTSGTLLSNSSSETAKLVLSNTQSANIAYIKLELNILGSSALTYNSSGDKPMFSDSTVMNATASNGTVTLVANGAIAQYSYMFLDAVLSNLQVTGAMINATLQIKASVSLESGFTNSSTNILYYNLSTSSVVLPTGENFVVSAVTQNPEIGKPYTFQVAMDESCNKTAPTVVVNGTTLTEVSGSNGVYTFTIASLQGGESIVITPVINTYTITITPTDSSEYKPSDVTQILSHGDYISVSGYTIYYRQANSSTKTELYSGSYGSCTVSEYYLNDKVLSTSTEFQITADVTITADWVYRSCVAANTKIATGFNGEYKLAKDIKLGDYVLGMDMKTGKPTLSQVMKVFVKQNNKIYTVTFDDGSQIRLTGNHPMFTKRGWVCTNYDEFIYEPHAMGNDIVETTSLKIGDKVKSQYSYKTVVSIECKPNTENVYDFTVAKIGNFFADGALLHNSPKAV